MEQKPPSLDETDEDIDEEGLTSSMNSMSSTSSAAISELISSVSSTSSATNVAPAAPLSTPPIQTVPASETKKESQLAHGPPSPAIDTTFSNPGTAGSYMTTNAGAAPRRKSVSTSFSFLLFSTQSCFFKQENNTLK